MSEISHTRIHIPLLTPTMTQSHIPDNLNVAAPNTPYFTPIQHPPAGTGIDVVDDANKELPKIFHPIQIRGVLFPNRIWVGVPSQYLRELADTGLRRSYHPCASIPHRMATSRPGTWPTVSTQHMDRSSNIKKLSKSVSLNSGWNFNAWARPYHD